MLSWSAALAAPHAPPVDEPLRTGAVAAADVALVIGNEEYFAVSDVAYARRDAAAVGAWLTHTRGVPPERVRLLQDVAAEQITAAVAELAPQVGDGGTFWLYFAGHGAADPSTGARLLLGNDVQPDPAVFLERAVRVEDLQRAAAAQGDVVMLIDACFNGAGRDGDLIGEAKRFAVPSYAVPVRQVVEWAATGPEQLAGQWHAAEHGTFTYLALGALRGWADGELDGAPDGVVTLAEAQAYVARTLTAVAVEDQTPQLTGAGDVKATAGSALEPPPPIELLSELPGVAARSVRQGRTGGLVAGGVVLGGVASLAAGFVTRADLRADVESGAVAPADATGKATLVNGLLGAGYAGLALGVGLGGGVVVFVSDAPGVGWRARW